jgi:hypothetical protein
VVRSNAGAFFFLAKMLSQKFSSNFFTTTDINSPDGAIKGALPAQFGAFEHLVGPAVCSASCVGLWLAQSELINRKT